MVKLVLFLLSVYIKLLALIQVIIFPSPNILNWILRSLSFLPSPLPQLILKASLADTSAHLLSFLRPFGTGNNVHSAKRTVLALMKSYCLQAVDNFCKVCLKRISQLPKQFTNSSVLLGKKRHIFCCFVLETVRTTNQGTEYLGSTNEWYFDYAASVRFFGICNK